MKESSLKSSFAKGLNLMRSVDMDDLLAIARSLNQLRIRYAFTGGAILGFLLDNPHLPFPRTTDDVDAIVEVVTRIEYTRLEERLRKEAGFKNDTSQGAPLCRWLAGNTRVDIMPIHDQTGNFSDLWFDYALESSSVQLIKGVPVSIVSAACFIATKLNAFNDRGKEDYWSSHDLEDILTVVDGRDSIIDDLRKERSDLRDYVSTAFNKLLNTGSFIDALPGHLPSDDASQARLPILLERLHAIARLSPCKLKKQVQTDYHAKTPAADADSPMSRIIDA